MVAPNLKVLRVKDYLLLAGCGLIFGTEYIKLYNIQKSYIHDVSINYCAPQFEFLPLPYHLYQHADWSGPEQGQKQGQIEDQEDHNETVTSSYRYDFSPEDQLGVSR